MSVLVSVWSLLISMLWAGNLSSMAEEIDSPQTWHCSSPHSVLVSSLLTPFATRKGGKACIWGLLCLPTITQNMSIEVVKIPRVGEKKKRHIALSFLKRWQLKICGVFVSFMHNNMSFIFAKYMHGTSWSPKNLKRNTVNIQKIWMQ